MAIAEHSPEFVTHLTKRINVLLDTESIGALIPICIRQMKNQANRLGKFWC